jgi:hypothetical protein
MYKKICKLTILQRLIFNFWKEVSEINNVQLLVLYDILNSNIVLGTPIHSKNVLRKKKAHPFGDTDNRKSRFLTPL